MTIVSLTDDVLEITPATLHTPVSVGVVVLMALEEVG